MTIFSPYAVGRIGDTQIHFLAHHLDAETSVLRDTPLGDVQACENLDARGDRQLQRFRRRFRLDQFAIDTVTQLAAFVETARCECRMLFP